jgi:acetoin utilization protein AcuB
MSTPIPPVRDFMTTSPVTIGSDQSMAQASDLMREHGIRHLPVLAGGQLLGVISDRDVKIVESFPDVDPTELPVAEAIPQQAFVVAPDTPLDEVAREMGTHKYGSAVVMDGRQVVGIFTTVDACRALAKTFEP